MNMLPPRLAATAPLPLLMAGLAGAMVTLAVPAAAESVTASGRIVEETRAVSGFDRIALSGSLDIVVRQGGSEGLHLRGDDNVLPLIETFVDDGTLKIRFRRNTSVQRMSETDITVDVVRLSGLSSAGSGDIRVEGLQTPALRVSVAGSSDVQLYRLGVDTLELDVAGSGDIGASGSARRLAISIAGSGDVGAAPLVAEEVSVRIAGSGDVRYGGSAGRVNTRVMGSGSLIRR